MEHSFEYVQILWPLRTNTSFTIASRFPVPAGMSSLSTLSSVSLVGLIHVCLNRGYACDVTNTCRPYFHATSGQISMWLVHVLASLIRSSKQWVRAVVLLDVQGYTFIIFPRRRARWIATIDCENWEPNEYSWICSTLCCSEAKSNDPLSPDYVPHVFSHSKSPVKRG